MEHLFGHTRVDGSGRDRIDVDCTVRPLQGEGFDQTDQSSLRGGVGGKIDARGRRAPTRKA